MELHELRPAWHAQAKYHGLTELFYGPTAENHQARRKRELKAAALCALCPVAEECRAGRDAHGMWGGIAEHRSRGHAVPMRYALEAVAS